jgi:hypothetical protein
MLVDGPSGVGKTTLPYCLGKDFIHLVLADLGDNAQSIYACLNPRSSAFRSALRLDVARCLLNRQESGPRFGTTALLDYAQPLQSAAVLAEFLGIKHTGALLVCELRNAIKDQYPVPEKRPILCLDEVPAYSEEGQDFIALARNLGRVVGLVVMMMGTDSTAANLVAHGGSRGGNGQAWAHLVLDLPKLNRRTEAMLRQEFKATKDTSRSEFVCDEVLTARPWLAELMIRWEAETQDDDDEHHLDKLRNFVAGEIARAKNTHTRQWLRGQVCLHMPRYLPASETQIDSKGLHSVHAHTSSFVTKHMALLRHPDEAKCHQKRKGVAELTLTGHQICFAGQVWVPKCEYPLLEHESILYLSLMGTKEFPAFCSPESGRRLSTLQAHRDVVPVVDTVSTDYQNPNEMSLDGDWLEGVGQTAIGSASREMGVRGTTLKALVPCVCAELSEGDYKLIQVEDTDWNWVGSLADLQVPYLLPTSLVPAHLRQVSGTFFGSIFRPERGQRRDFVVQASTANGEWKEGAISGEAKNYQAPLSLTVLKNMLERVPAESKLHLIVCNELQQKYFTLNDSYVAFEHECETMRSSVLLRVRREPTSIRLVLLDVNRGPLDQAKILRVVLFIALTDLVGDCLFVCFVCVVLFCVWKLAARLTLALSLSVYLCLSERSYLA